MKTLGDVLVFLLMMMMALGVQVAATSSPIQGPTLSPTTQVPTHAPTTLSPTTHVPTTLSPTTATPTTSAPTTSAPTTPAPSTYAPTTASPTTSAPTTKLPTTQSPTTSAPATGSPTTSHPTTSAPTTKKPTKNPTRLPTKPPTMLPTNSPIGFFGPGGAAVGVQGFDLFLLLDLSASMSDFDSLCSTVSTISGSNSQTCWDLTIDFSLELIYSIAQTIGFAGPNPGANGLRVIAMAFGCKKEQKHPLVFPILPNWEGSRSVIMTAFSNAQADLYSQGGSCPQRALAKMVEQVENGWSDNNLRPYKGLLTITDGILYNGKTRSSLSTVNAIFALNQRCVSGLTLTPVIGTSLVAQQLTQKKYLNVLTGNVQSREFQMTDGEAAVISEIGIEFGNIMTQISSNPVCSDPTSFSNPESYWCAYSIMPMCSTRPSCVWYQGLGCRKSTSSTDCGDMTSQSSCLSQSGCLWNKLKGKLYLCVPVDTGPVNCSSLVMKNACKEKNLFCTWDHATHSCSNAPIDDGNPGNDSSGSNCTSAACNCTSSDC